MARARCWPRLLQVLDELWRLGYKLSDVPANKYDEPLERFIRMYNLPEVRARRREDAREAGGAPPADEAARAARRSESVPLLVTATAAAAPALDPHDGRRRAHTKTIDAMMAILSKEEEVSRHRHCRRRRRRRATTHAAPTRGQVLLRRHTTPQARRRARGAREPWRYTNVKERRSQSRASCRASQRRATARRASQSRATARRARSGRAAAPGHLTLHGRAQEVQSRTERRDVHAGAGLIFCASVAAARADAIAGPCARHDDDDDDGRACPRGWTHLGENKLRGAGGGAGARELSPAPPSLPPDRCASLRRGGRWRSRARRSAARATGERRRAQARLRGMQDRRELARQRKEAESAVAQSGVVDNLQLDEPEPTAESLLSKEDVAKAQLEKRAKELEDSKDALGLSDHDSQSLASK